MSMQSYGVFVAPPKDIPRGVKLTHMQLDKESQTCEDPRGSVPCLKCVMKCQEDSLVKFNHLQLKQMPQLVLYHSRYWRDSIPW